MKTAYKVAVASPLQIAQRNAFDVRNEKHPVHQEVVKSIGTYEFTATFEEDIQTLEMFKHIPGMVAFICTLKKGNEIIGYGHGTAVLSKMNKFVDRTVRTAFNAALVDCVVRSTKILDALHIGTNQSQDMGQSEFVRITDKQKSYLRELIQTNVDDEDERQDQLAGLDDLSREEASSVIQSFLN